MTYRQQGNSSFVLTSEQKDREGRGSDNLISKNKKHQNFPIMMKTLYMHAKAPMSLLYFVVYVNKIMPKVHTFFLISSSFFLFKFSERGVSISPVMRQQLGDKKVSPSYLQTQIQIIVDNVFNFLNGLVELMFWHCFVVCNSCHCLSVFMYCLV